MTNLIYFVLISAVIVQVVYFCMVFGRFAFAKSRQDTTIGKKAPVSVLICAKNEAENLKRYLPSILEQNHPNFEVVVVNDGSIDDTENILKVFSQKYQHLKIVSVQNQDARRKGKRNALRIGILKTQNEYLLLTDADCQPTSKNWITNMTCKLNENTDIVLGYSPYLKQAGFLNSLVRFETFQTAIQYFSFALIGQPYMGVGRNLAYKKSLFINSGQFQGNGNTLSGDDDLFINEFARSANTEIVFDEESMMISRPKESLSSWLQQKRRHLSSGVQYKIQHQLMLGGYIFSLFAFYAALILAVINSMNPIIISTIFLVRLLIQLVVFQPAMKKLQTLDIWFLTPVLDIAYTLYYFIISPLTLLKPVQSWK